MPNGLIVALLLISTGALAQGAKSLEQLRREDDLQRTMEALNKLDAQIGSMAKRREADCSMAVGYRPFCDCVMKDLPIAWGFADYVAITTRTKEQNGYSKMDKDSRSAYDLVAPVRDRCVKLINAKP